jgi:hypothetical protein
MSVFRPILRDALVAGADVFARAQQACDELPDVPSNACITFADAQQIVAKREEEKRKKESKNDAKNRRKPAPEQVHPPGSRLGVDPDVSAYWMVIEVRAQSAT